MEDHAEAEVLRQRYANEPAPGPFSEWCAARNIDPTTLGALASWAARRKAHGLPIGRPTWPVGGVDLLDPKVPEAWKEQAIRRAVHAPPPPPRAEPEPVLAAAPPQPRRARWRQLAFPSVAFAVLGALGAQLVAHGNATPAAFLACGLVSAGWGSIGFALLGRRGPVDE